MIVAKVQEIVKQTFLENLEPLSKLFRRFKFIKNLSLADFDEKDLKQIHLNPGKPFF